MSEQRAPSNPYEAPQSLLQGGEPCPRRAHARESVELALSRLDEHLRDPRRVEADRRMEERLLTGGVAVALLAVLVGGMAGLLLRSEELWLVRLLTAGATIPTGLIAVALVGVGWLVGPRSRAHEPVAALRQHLRAMARGRAGTLVAGLCPTARGVDARCPDLTPVATGGREGAAGGLRLDAPLPARRWLRCFARSDRRHARWMRIGELKLVDSSPDVAVVEATVSFVSWPQWVNCASLAVFLIAWPLGLLAAAGLYLGLRCKRRVTFARTLVRGRDGLWYLLVPDLLEAGD